MKKYLLPQEGTFYKANLHCHSSFSDGRLSPEEIKKIYMEKGYSIIAYTDHNILLSHEHLNDENFLALNGLEIDIEEAGEDWLACRECHVCMIALSSDNLTVPCYHRTKYLNPKNAANHRDKLVTDNSLPDFERVYTPECISEIMKTGREKGFFVTYNHPAWSMETSEQFLNYNGMHAMEICNYECLVSGHNDYNEKEYDRMLRSGKRIFCIGTDDNHNNAQENARQFGSFGAFTMIKASALEYKEITDALVKGNFYASQGPLINNLVYEDGKIYIECSDADSIVLNTGRRHTETAYSDNNIPLNEACFNVLQRDVYFRITVTDSKGRHANTNAYFIDEL